MWFLKIPQTRVCFHVKNENAGNGYLLNKYKLEFKNIKK